MAITEWIRIRTECNSYLLTMSRVCDAKDYLLKLEDDLRENERLKMTLSLQELSENALALGEGEGVQGALDEETQSRIAYLADQKRKLNDKINVIQQSIDDQKVIYAAVVAERDLEKASLESRIKAFFTRSYVTVMQPADLFAIRIMVEICPRKWRFTLGKRAPHLEMLQEMGEEIGIERFTPGLLYEFSNSTFRVLSDVECKKASFKKK